MSTFFISDPHFGHKNILKFSRPQFASIEEHDEFIVQSINAVVGKRDRLFILGDIAWGEHSIAHLGRLKGLITIVKGNHDTYATEKYLKYVNDVKGVVANQQFVYTHVPIHPQELEYRWKYNIHGHLHGGRVHADSYKIVTKADEWGMNGYATVEILPGQGDVDKRYFCVSCENINFKPISIEEISQQLGIE